MEERLRFVGRLLDGEAMTDVCREFGISRKTGYKIFDRYKEHGLEALSDRSRRPVRYANQLPQPIESLIVRLKGEKPHLGGAQDPRAPGAPSGWRGQGAGQEHHPRGSRPSRLGQARRRAAPSCARHAAVGRRCA
jgi:transposase-like protein